MPVGSFQQDQRPLGWARQAPSLAVERAEAISVVLVAAENRE
jgi:hypothetical protein